ncbi:hypothetical protein AHAS_Ahas15G0355400 [Arachis hypogaea]
MEEDENTLITRIELARILKGKGEGYQPPTFRKFDGTGSAKEHILSFLDDLGVFRNHQEPKIKEFSKLLTGRAFTWYYKLKANSINTWEQLVTEFCNKFLKEEPSIHIIDLGRVKQRQGEGLVAFIKRYIDKALLCIDTLPEAQLVYGCIRNVEDRSQIYLSMSNINTFFELLKRASDLTEAMKRNGRRSKEVFPLEVCTADGRGRRSSYSRGAKRNNPPPSLPLFRAQAMIVVNGWFEDGTLNPRTDREPPTPKELRDPKYCMVHRNKSHGLTDYYVMRTIFHRQVKEGKILLDGEQNQEGVKSTPFPQHDVGMVGVEGEVMLTEIVVEAEEMVTMEKSLDEDTLTRGLLKSRGEAHLVDASFYEELALPGVNKIRPVWECVIETPKPKAVRKNTLMEEAPKENTKKQATPIEDLGLRKEILPGGGYKWCILKELGGPAEKNYQNSPGPDILSV